jgi:hypothetical protein
MAKLRRLPANHHVQTSGVYTVEPYEPAGSNPKALKVRTPSGDWYYVEYRQALGFDAATLANNTNVTNGVLVHLWRAQNSNGVFLLDMTPDVSDWGHPALGCWGRVLGRGVRDHDHPGLGQRHGRRQRDGRQRGHHVRQEEPDRGGIAGPAARQCGHDAQLCTVGDQQ